MKAIFDGKLYSVVEMVNDTVVLEPIHTDVSDGDDLIEVNLADLRLTLDPSEDQVDEVSDMIHFGRSGVWI
jgi:hypothetical protein